MPDFAKCFFVRYAQIYEAYVERTLIKFVYSCGKTVAKVGAREIPRVHDYNNSFYNASINFQDQIPVVTILPVYKLYTLS